jgi:hypothetical protein
LLDSAAIGCKPQVKLQTSPKPTSGPEQAGYFVTRRNTLFLTN